MQTAWFTAVREPTSESHALTLAPYRASHDDAYFPDRTTTQAPEDAFNIANSLHAGPKEDPRRTNEQQH